MWSKNFPTLHFSLYGIEYVADVTVWCEKSIEGEDADGNRGECVSSITTLKINEVRDLIGKPVSNVTANMSEAIEEALYKEDLEPNESN